MGTFVDMQFGYSTLVNLKLVVLEIGFQYPLYLYWQSP
jgi:hypothetical protein